MPEPDSDEVEATEEAEDSPDDQPAIDDDEMADISAVAEQVEAEAGATADDEDSDQPATDEESGDLALDPDDDRTSIGDVYCNVLGMGAAVARDQYGELDRDRKDVLDEYADIARDLDIDDAVDDWIDQHGGPDQLSPGQTIIVMTVVWGGMVVMDDPAILDNLGGDE